MFCDLVGSTALSTRHDPEDLRRLLGDYHRAVAETVGRYFGYPHAHEDDAELAVHAALALTEAVGRLAAREDLRVRLGIATGLAVVGDSIGEGAAQERGVVGETPNPCRSAAGHRLAEHAGDRRSDPPADRRVV